MSHSIVHKYSVEQGVVLACLIVWLAPFRQILTQVQVGSGTKAVKEFPKQGKGFRAIAYLLSTTTIAGYSHYWAALPLLSAARAGCDDVAVSR